MATLIHERVEQARAGKNPYVIAKLKSGWVVIGDVQPLDGYCLLLADPVVPDLNSLDLESRRQYCEDMTHIMPRFKNEPEEKRRMPACMVYEWRSSRKFELERDRGFIEKMRQLLKAE